MKFTVALIAILSISSTWASEVTNKAEDPKGKREAAVGYSSQGISAQHYQAPIGHEGANAISVGAGYSVGGAKPSYSLGGHSSSPLQFSSEGLQPSGHATIKLAPITLQHNQGFASGDLSQLMSQISHSINSGALNLQPTSGLESYGYAQAAPQEHGAQELSLAQFPQFQQYMFAEQPQVASPPSYAAGTKGLGSYGSTGPVLFTPSDSHNQGNAATLQSYAPSSGQAHGESLGAAAYTLSAAPSSGHNFGGSSILGHSLGEGAISLGGSGHSFGGAGHSLGGSGLSLGGSGHALGGSGHSLGGHSLGASYTLGGSGHNLGGLTFSKPGNSYGGSYKNILSGKGSFKPSAFLGAAIQGDSSHGSSGLSESHGAPSFGGYSSGGHGGLSLGSLSHGSSLGGHGASFGSLGSSFGGQGSSLGGHGSSLGGHSASLGGSSGKYVASFAPSKSEGYGNLESVSSFGSSGHSSPSSSYYSPSSHGHANSAHAASNSQHYYAPSSKYSSSSFGEGQSSYKAPSSHGSLSAFSSGPKPSFGRHSHYSSPRDIQGSYSENSYNTIKYSEELKPRV